MSTCADCHDAFDARGPWQTRCWPCYRAHRDRKATQAYQTGYLDGYTAANTTTRPALDAGLLADLVALCHPDRHPPERADKAHRATVALLDLRATDRKAAA